MASRGLGGSASECARRPLPAKPLNPSTPATVAAASAQRADGDRAPGAAGGIGYRCRGGRRKCLPRPAHLRPARSWSFRAGRVGGFAAVRCPCSPGRSGACRTASARRSGIGAGRPGSRARLRNGAWRTWWGTRWSGPIRARTCSNAAVRSWRAGHGTSRVETLPSPRRALRPGHARAPVHPAAEVTRRLEDRRLARVAGWGRIRPQGARAR